MLALENEVKGARSLRWQLIFEHVGTIGESARDQVEGN